MERMLRIKDVIKITAMSNSTIYGLIKSNDFPRPKRIGKRAVGWLENDIQLWLETRPPAGSWEFLTNEPF